MSSSPIILILGAGPNIGHHVAQAFATKGYKIALASRKAKDEDSNENQVNISSAFANPDAVVDVFAKVKKLLGSPSVVVYNGQTQLSSSTSTKALLTLWKLVVEA